MATRHALVTGGGSGIGLAVARRLREDGFCITVSGRTEHTLAASGFAYVVMDVTDEDQVNAALASLEPVDLVVSNAGQAQTAPLLQTPLDLWQAMLAVNLTGAFLCARAAIPAMIERGWGRFIVIASSAALKGYAYTGAYTSSKHGVLGLVRTLAIELAKTGVTANAVCPGFTDTPLLSRSIDTIVGTTDMNREQAKGALLAGNPMARAVTPVEVAAAVAWLAGSEAGATNGQAIVIDGGELAG